jgi:DNA-binding NtrC family response regulator
MSSAAEEIVENESPELLRRPQILVVDDELAMVRSLELLLRSCGQIHKAYSVPEAEELLATGTKVDCIVTDVSMPEASGLVLLDLVKKKYAGIPVIVMTAYSSVPQAVEAMQRGAFKYLVKPFENSDMVDVVKKAISKKGLTLGETRKLPTGWVCNSQAMKDFISQAEKMAAFESPLLILGSTGVGKSRAARWIHEQSNRSKKDFVAVDGRAHIDDSALFTLTTSKVGSVFVAEVFSLPKRAQDRLVEIIQEQKVRVIGSSSSSPELQSLPGFREDLFHALTAMLIKMPNLADRPADFEALVRENLERLMQKLKLKSLELEATAFEKLKNYTFPGSVKELERILERAALQARSGIIQAEALVFEDGNLRQILPFSIPVEDGWNRIEVLRESLERDLIGRAFEQYPNCSNTEIADILGTTRRILELRMKAYRIRENS